MRPWHDLDSVETHLADSRLDDQDLDLLEHVLGDGRPPQGLHQQGHGRRRRTAPAFARSLLESDLDEWWNYDGPGALPWTY